MRRKEEAKEKGKTRENEEEEEGSCWGTRNPTSSSRKS